MESDTMGPQPTAEQPTGVYRSSPDRALQGLKERIRQKAPLRWAEHAEDGEPEVVCGPDITELDKDTKSESSSVRREMAERRLPEYERREPRANMHRNDWGDEYDREQYSKNRDRDRAPPKRVFNPQTGVSYVLPYESRDRYIISHLPSEPPTFRGYGITEYLEKWELHAGRSQWSEEEIIDNFLFNVDRSLGKEVKEARPKDRKWATYKTNLCELYKLEDSKYSIKDLETMTQDEDESVQAFGKRFQKISGVLIEKGKLSEVERCTIFIGRLPMGKQKAILRDLPNDKLDFPEVLKLAMKAGADDYRDLVWRGMRRRDSSLYRKYDTDRCPDFKDYPWSDRGDVKAVMEEVREMREMMKRLARQVTDIATKAEATTCQDKPGSPYSHRWDRSEPGERRANITDDSDLREMIKALTRQIAWIEAKMETGGYQARNGSSNLLRCDRVRTGSAYSLKWDNRGPGSRRPLEDRNPQTLTDYRSREQRYHRRCDDSPRYQDEDRDRQTAYHRDYAGDRDNGYRRHGRVETYPHSPIYDPGREDLRDAE
ncbi:hypothetical protein CBR_g34034 [Chara braunii]|uniref:Retrotransposon gag domain-containing protein n=1 Tax=Chara braunii TaxID=69332 RepID=A0A388LHW7_CHABU|nr:hypothetical protein CBR_g34034 [Chara braunii]|eukprot:GBG81851.1 hypothetical protein CBR_g34034 [Chara braunii]